MGRAGLGLVLAPTLALMIAGPSFRAKPQTCSNFSLAPDVFFVGSGYSSTQHATMEGSVSRATHELIPPSAG